MEVKDDAAAAPDRRAIRAGAIALGRLPGDALDRLDHLVGTDGESEQLAGGRSVAGAQRESLAQREWIFTACDRELLHLALVRERGLRRTEAAKRAMRRMIRRDAAP